MERPRVVAFTDTYLPTVNGVTYTVETWRRHWEQAGGRMDVVYPDSTHTPEYGEHPVGSVPLPFYEGFRVGSPQIPDSVGDIELVHAHTPFSLGLAGRRLAQSRSAPLVTSYHTPTAEYANYISGVSSVERVVRETASSYEQWFLRQADMVIVPSRATEAHVREKIGNSTPVSVISNGVDTSQFRPTQTEQFRERHGIPGSDVLVGYTGRHGYEKELERLVDAVEPLEEVRLVFSGDGPARDELVERSQELGVDAHFLGFLDRDELPAFYSLLDVFAFPSPVETEGIVALEAIACGTPVAGVEAGGLAERIEEGVTGYTAQPGDTDALRETIVKTIEDGDTLRQSCLDQRQSLSVTRSVSRLREVYNRVLSGRPTGD